MKTNCDRAAMLNAIPPIVGTKEAAEILGVTVGTLRNRAYLGLPPRNMKVGRRLRYTRVALLEYMGLGSERSDPSGSRPKS